MRWLRDMDPGDVRERITDVNDGILAITGTGLGLAGAEVGASTSYAVLGITATAGTLSMFAVKLGEMMAEREAQQSAADHERRNLDADPEAELAELIAWFERHGVQSATARRVAEEMSDADALGAQLELEYGFGGVATFRETVTAALWAGFAFFLGAFLPVLVTVLVPLQWRTEWTLLVAGCSLAATSLVLARRGHSNVTMTVVRSLLIGLATLAVTYLVGDWLI